MVNFRLSHNFGGSYTRLLPLQAFGEVSVEHVEIRFPQLSRAPTDFFGPLRGAEVSHLCVSFDWLRGAEEEAAFLAFCFDQHSEVTSPRIRVHNARVRRDYLKRIAEVSPR